MQCDYVNLNYLNSFELHVNIKHKEHYHYDEKIRIIYELAFKYIFFFPNIYS